MNILLVEPSFPIPAKSKNHKNFLPIGLLKLHGYYASRGHKAKILRGNKDKRRVGTRFKPDEIMITSLFTYWSSHVKQSVQHYRGLYPDSRITVGGIYASLMPEHCREYTGCDDVFVGVHEEAEAYAAKNGLDYRILENPHPLDYQIVHASRGCFRRCEFCGTWKIEPKPIYKKSIKNEVCSKKLVFYDNNLLANPSIEDLLSEIVEMRASGSVRHCESQSGFDGRILLQKPELARMLKKAGFVCPRVSWDGSSGEHGVIREQIDILAGGGYRPKDIFVFMLYNWRVPFKGMEEKRKKCWSWGVQIADCRYRPLDQTYDNYLPHKADQTSRDYYIHGEAGWTDELIKQFRRNIRRQNICVRQDVPFYSRKFEKRLIGTEAGKKLKKLRTKREKVRFMRHIGADFWFPDEKDRPEAT